ncbi:hypothetical protein [Nocardioides sp.]|uniref:phage tail protein n=1 Tax=Nocardioides sp. TaxID=35761 RepID=UPI002619B27A|nr:hypothetical protein [Nocardioides sp.]MDI6908634.1 hypothetical protein [Nocardioides sp.]
MPGPIKIAVLANGRQAKAELSGVAATAERVSGRMAKLRLPAALALGGIALGARKAVSAASDLNETISKTDQIFGRQSAGIQKFADGAATALGQSKVQALDAAATFGLIGQKAGLTSGKTADFARQFTTLASDLASFNNTTPEEAITAIGAAMRGESEPIRRYGVLLDDATLRARALKMGLIKTTKDALTPQQKALAASHEILAQTSKAQGDFARTSDGAANKARIVAAQTENLSAALGQALLPAWQRVLQVASSVVGVMSRHQTTAKALVVVVAALAAGVLVVSAATSVVSAATAAWTAVAVVASAAQKAATAAALGTRIGLAALAVQTAITSAASKAAAAAQWLLNAALSANPIGLVVIAIAALVAGIVIAYRKSETFRAIVDKAFAGIKTAITVAVDFVVKFVKKHWPKLLVILTGPIGLAVVLIIKHWSKIKAATRAAWSVIRAVVGKAVAVVKAIVTTEIRVVRTIITGAWNVVKTATKAAWTAFKNIITTQVRLAVAVVRGIKDKVSAVFSGALDWLVDAGKNIIRGLISGIDSMIGAVKDKLGKLTDLIPDIKGPPAKDRRLLRPAGQMIIEGLIDGIDDAIPDVKRKLGGVTDLLQHALDGRYSPTLSVDLATSAYGGSSGSLLLDRGMALLESDSGPAQPARVTMRFTAQQVSQLQRGREIQADLDVYRAAGGRTKVRQR